MRGYREQFEPEIADQIEDIVRRINEIEYPTGPSRFYGLDLTMCLQAGALAGSMVLASAWLELYVRGLIVRYLNNAQTKLARKFDAERKLENQRGLNFQKMLDHLVDSDLFNLEDSELAKELYKKIRIPMHHGLPARLLEQNGCDPIREFMTLFGKSPIVTLSAFEEYVEAEALPIIEKILAIIERNQFNPSEIHNKKSHPTHSARLL